MADGVTVDNGALTDFEVATDEVNINGQGVKHAQYIKIADGTNGGTNVNVVDAAGNVMVSLGTRLSDQLDHVSLMGTFPSYTGADRVPTVATNGTIVFTLQGSSTKTIEIMSVQVTLSATSAGMQLVLLDKLSDAPTGGSNSAVSVPPHDSNFAAATAVMRKWTANPTGGGTSVGMVGGKRIPVPNASTPAFPATPLDFLFGQNGDSPLFLRGTSQHIAVTFVGTTLSGLDATCQIKWREVA